MTEYAHINTKLIELKQYSNDNGKSLITMNNCNLMKPLLAHSVYGVRVFAGFQ